VQKHTMEEDASNGDLKPLVPEKIVGFPCSQSIAPYNSSFSYFVSTYTMRLMATNSPSELQLPSCPPD